MSETPSRWIRLKWAFLGKPVSYEEHRAAQASHFRDERSIAYCEARSHRFHNGGF